MPFDGAPDFQLQLQPKQLYCYRSPATEVLYGGAAFGGKALAVDTLIPTPSGWTTMGALSVGDLVIGSDGRPVPVVAATDVMHGRPCMSVTTADGERIVCDESHLWVTMTEGERLSALRRTPEWRANRRQRRPSRSTGKRPDLALANSARNHETLSPLSGVVRTAREICDDLSDRPHSIACAAAIDVPDADLPIDPYVLGVWLGDGTATQAAFTSADAEIVQRVANSYPVTQRANPLSFGIPGGMLDRLRATGLLGNKHIPPAYLRASRKQRLELVRGLMDTDGHATDGGAAEFTTTSLALRDGVRELLWSLGLKPSESEGRARLRGMDCGAKWRFKVWAPFPLFHLPRKAIRQKLDIGTKTQRRFIRVTPTESLPVRCIQVANADGIFLCGRSMLPTHNSHLMRQAAISWCLEIPGLQVYIFRRVEDDLIKNHVEGPTGFRNLLADKTWAKVLQGEIRFTNGSRIFLCHCKDEDHKYKYHGSEIHVLMIDELTTFTESIYRYLRFRVRMVNIDLPAHYRKGFVCPDGSVLKHNLFPRILNGSNPGNIGHHWVKRTFVQTPNATIAHRVSDAEGGMVRQYIPALLQDNPAGVAADPTYVNRMRGLGDPALVKAMELGDWNILAGGFFPEFSLMQHVLKRQELPKEIFSKRFIGVDWGSAKPFSVGWYAIADEDWTTEGVLGNKIVVPRGSLVRYREWYGMKPGQNNVGLKLNVDRWAKGVLERTAKDETIEYVVADTQMWAEDGGPSLAERAMKVKLRGKVLHMRKADKQRPTGWDQVRQRLRENPDDDASASLFLTENCYEAIRIIQSVQHDDVKVEDIDTDQEDHAVDELRYACMSRPRAKHLKTKRKPRGPKPWTMDWLDKMDSQEKKALERRRMSVH